MYVVANKTEGQLTEQMAQSIEECGRCDPLKSEGWDDFFCVTELVQDGLGGSGR